MFFPVWVIINTYAMREMTRPSAGELLLDKSNGLWLRQLAVTAGGFVGMQGTGDARIQHPIFALNF